MAAALEFQGTTKHFGSHVALDQLSLTVERGEILGFLGPNGAGKTTAIHLALGFLRSTTGGGTILGNPFGDTRSRARIGFLPDSPAFFAGTALGAVELAGRLNNVRDPQLRERAKSLLAKLNLTAAGKDARRFSRGMQQRLGMAQALVNDPELLILDEPTSALDPPGVLEVRGLLQTARDEGKSIFFSSNQLSEVEQICDRIAFLDHGRLLRHGPLAAFLEDSGRIEVVLQNLPAESEALLPYRQYGSESSENGMHFVIPVRLQRELIERAWAAGGTLKSVAPLRRTLEDLFVAWTENTPGKPKA
ncbi:MAG TPA: ABC transporter ATP-binding protein [Alloacidobacterium sp.]|nr:ABC transporter ATP-binding protein [Alloacidobacterium sp.]